MPRQDRPASFFQERQKPFGPLGGECAQFVVQAWFLLDSSGPPGHSPTLRSISRKKQVCQAHQADIDKDVEPLPADVLSDLVDLGCDPDTGEHFLFAGIKG